MKQQLTLNVALGSLLAGGLWLAAPAFSAGSPQNFGPQRTPIHSLPYTIDTCGSYYLTGSLLGVAGAHGINVTADDVTLDLNGFSLVGVPGSLDGIHSTGKRLKVTDGFIADWGDDGIDTTGFVSHFERLMVRSCGDIGIHGSRRARIERCTTTQNGGHGIWAEEMAQVDRCISSNNAGAGLYVTQSSGIARYNIFTQNAHGVEMPSGIGWIFKENAVGYNDGHGIQTAQDCLVSDNVSSNNGLTSIGAGIQPGTGGYIIGNVVNSNDYGINAPLNQPTPDVITGNSAVGNTAANYTGFAGDDFGPPGSAAGASSPFANISN